MIRTLYFSILFSAVSCNQEFENQDGLPPENTDQAIYYEGYRDLDALVLSYDTLTSDSLIPRNTTVQVSARISVKCQRFYRTQTEF